jgi:hypothetical protein
LSCHTPARPGILSTVNNPFDLWLRASRRRHRNVFSRIFRENSWGDAESVSGPGSTRARGATLLPALVDLVRQLRIETLLDAPCGDFNWAHPLADAVASYIGVDVVDDIIARNVREHGSAKRTFLTRDITRDPLPRADLVLSRDCLVHFSFADIRAALRNFRRSGSEYLLTTTFIDRASNENMRPGGWRVLNLQAPPFRIPTPLAFVDEQVLHSGGLYRDKRLGLWRLADLSL